MFGLASWFILSLAGGLLTLSAVWSRKITRWRLVTLLGYLASIVVTGGAVLVSQGWASPCYLLLPGKYSMISYLPVPEETIYLFLDTEYGPKTCYIPWDNGKADQLKKDEEGDGSEFTVEWGLKGEGNGIPGIDAGIGEISTRPPQNNHEDKPVEEPPTFGD